MAQVKFLYGATCFNDDGSRTEIDKGAVYDILADFKKDGYRMMTIVADGVSQDFIYDREDMRVC